MTDDQSLKLVSDTAEMLMEDFDSVVIIVTKHQNKESRLFGSGKGNLYARLGSVQSYLDQETSQNIEGNT